MCCSAAPVFAPVGRGKRFAVIRSLWSRYLLLSVAKLAPCGREIRASPVIWPSAVTRSFQSR